ncbi:thiol-disulfide oxidoreductase DCC family protein [Rhizosphaericola mali]|uniref:DUF393 domain-containing protein n=1 Tax=Rhizosphaericola mali TaxID=2545455 RepID=A0A5P2G4B6_9BACT|nr:DCC1-like thiol-disulfide oxidoreductase family protein [Rhizosphaericola mali]QES90355.1 DUF393 domain-containing protein [Rhizosphaericola mali]
MDVFFDRNIVFFDGVCNLCSGAVQFLLKRDKKEFFKYSSLQSEFARKNLPENLTNMQSIVYQENGQLYTQSTAVLKIMKHLNGIWPILYILILIPKFIRDFIYDYIAKNRYKWFGKKATCMIPNKRYISRFLE